MAELFKNLLECEAVMRHDLAEDGTQCAGAEGVVVGDGSPPV